MDKVVYLFGAFIAGWLIAQTAKLVTGIVAKKGKVTVGELVHFFTKSGGMPSGHTASLVALSTAVGLFYGFNNPVFPVIVCVTAIFIYDAVNVRYAVGEHGKLLNEMAISDNNPKTKPQKIVEGHTIPQVIIGGLLGIALGFAAFFVSGGSF